MLIDQHNAFLADNDTDFMRVQENYTQEEFSSLARAQPFPRCGKRALEHKEASQKKRKFIKASDFGLSLH